MSPFRNNPLPFRGLRLLLSLALVAAVGGIPSVRAQEESAAPPAGLLLSPGNVQTLSVEHVQRIAIGDPNIVDVTIVSPTQLLIQARQAGFTNLLIWDELGERELLLSVVDPKTSSLGEQLPAVLERMGLAGVKTEAQGGKVFLVGEVATEKQQDALEQMAAAYQGAVVNLAQVTPTAPTPTEPAPLVKLAVQVVEINRTDLDELGVNWSDSLSLTQPSVTDLTFSESFRWGTGLTRGAFSATINALAKKNKARILSEPSLVTSSGKAASSFIGVEVPVLKDASLQTCNLVFTTEFRQTGVLLKITPTVVSANGGREQKITTVLEAEVSDIDTASGLSVPVGSTTVLVPGFKVRNAKTEVTTASGEAIVIAGLLDFKDEETTEQIPYLGSVPVFGRLFRSPKFQTKEVELVVTVTPELVPATAEAELKAVLPQQEQAAPTPEQLSVAQVTTSVADPRLEYLLQVQQAIAEHLRYPDREGESGVQGSLKLRLQLYADGRLGQIHVVESSGVDAFDQEAVRAAESLEPYQPFPAQLMDRELWFDVPVIFRPQ